MYALNADSLRTHPYNKEALCAGEFAAVQLGSSPK